MKTKKQNIFEISATNSRNSINFGIILEKKTLEKLHKVKKNQT